MKRKKAPTVISPVAVKDDLVKRILTAVNDNIDTIFGRKTGSSPFVTEQDLLNWRVIIRNGEDYTVSHTPGVVKPSFSSISSAPQQGGINVQSNGYVVRTSSGVYRGGKIAGTANEIAITNTDGVPGDTTISLPPTISFYTKTINYGSFNHSYITGGEITASSIDDSPIGVFTPSIARFGDGLDFTQFSTDGSMRANGAAVRFKAITTDLSNTTLYDPMGDMFLSKTEGLVEFSDVASLSCYALMNLSLGSDWIEGSDVELALYWVQTQDKLPNWLVQYRWQHSKVTQAVNWTSLVCTTPSAVYTTGDLNQICRTAKITPPLATDITDTLQVRLVRDTLNGSGLFASVDTYTDEASAYKLDLIVKVDALGAATEYAK